MRVLLSPASTYGSTAEIGRRIAGVLRRYGIDVDVAQPEHLADLSPYAGFVLGSAIYHGCWKHEALELIDDHREVIASKPCWLFSSGPIAANLPDEPLGPEQARSLIAKTNAKAHRIFGWRLEIERLAPEERWLAAQAHVGNHDARPWAEIDEWATEIAAELITGPTRTPTGADLGPYGNRQC